MTDRNFYIGIDVGSVSSNFILMDDDNNIIEKIYLKTLGKPIEVIQEGLERLRTAKNIKTITGVGTTGSGRLLAGTIVGADIVKNEITAHAIAGLLTNPDVQTIIEIGGQDSKIIIIRNGIVVDFAMNTVCAAGTGSFLDRQANRLDIPIWEFGKLALKSTTKVRIAGRCAVFAESDMVHKQQMGYKYEDIIWGLCRALVRNYLNNVAKGKDIKGPILFQGGVAANEGIKAAFEDHLKCEVKVPKYFDVMGAYGAAILAKEKTKRSAAATNFYGFGNVCEGNYDSSSFECNGCSNSCEVIEIKYDGKVLSRWGDKCGKWSAIDLSSKESITI
ncbi:MAG TPA: 2-hydroxyglutaryl-CoA dehydratase [Thermoanaerobacterales bacterium]|nr:2-hydroxyglutaryl-CoA dehydratase [Thermoanaerobacterales bacterium]